MSDFLDLAARVRRPVAGAAWARRVALVERYYAPHWPAIGAWFSVCLAASVVFRLADAPGFPAGVTMLLMGMGAVVTAHYHAHPDEAELVLPVTRAEQFWMRFLPGALALVVGQLVMIVLMLLDVPAMFWSLVAEGRMTEPFHGYSASDIGAAFIFPMLMYAGAFLAASFRGRAWVTTTVTMASTMAAMMGSQFFLAWTSERWSGWYDVIWVGLGSAGVAGMTLWAYLRALSAEVVTSVKAEPTEDEVEVRPVEPRGVAGSGARAGGPATSVASGRNDFPDTPASSGVEVRRESRGAATADRWSVTLALVGLMFGPFSGRILCGAIGFFFALAVIPPAFSMKFVPMFIWIGVTALMAQMAKVHAEDYWLCVPVSRTDLFRVRVWPLTVVAALVTVGALALASMFHDPAGWSGSVVACAVIAPVMCVALPVMGNAVSPRLAASGMLIPYVLMFAYDRIVAFSSAEIMIGAAVVFGGAYHYAHEAHARREAVPAVAKVPNAG